jgi:putative flippase GtrA
MLRLSKKDIIFSLILGELSAWFLIFVIKNPYVTEFKGLEILENVVWYLPLIFPVLFLLGIFVCYLISRLVAVFFQIGKFVETGVLNTLVDIGILNLLVWFSGITAGAWLIPLNTLSFLCATTNSYYWNKFWTFKKGGSPNLISDSPSRKWAPEFVQFLVISGIGWGINTGIVVLGATFLGPLVDVSAGGWLNIMKITATLVAMCWNFIGYKFIVFKR